MYLRLRLHRDVFTRKHKLLFADAPFVYTKTVKTLVLSFHLKMLLKVETFKHNNAKTATLHVRQKRESVLLGRSGY